MTKKYCVKINCFDVINKVAVIDVESGALLRTIAVGRSPHGIYFRSHAARE